MIKIKFSIIFVLLSILSFVLIEYEKNKAIDDFLNERTKHFLHAYNIIYAQHKELANMIIYKILKDKEIIDIYKKISTANNDKKNSLRKKLYQYLISTHKGLEYNNDINMLHFHLPNSQSFLRMCKPEKFGDSLVGIRKMVTYVNTQKKPIDGFEVGRLHNGYRFVYPIFDEKHTHLGSVEVFFGADSFTSKLMHQYKTLSNFIISKNVLKKSWDTKKHEFIKSPFKGFYFENSTIKVLKAQDKQNQRKNRPNKRFRDKIVKYINKNIPMTFYSPDIKKTITFIPIQNPVTKKVVAALTIRNDANYIIGETTHFYILLVVVNFLIAIVLLLIYKDKRLHKILETKVKEKTKELLQANKNLDTKVKTQLKTIRKKDSILLEQSKLAQMGDMLNMIAHQWRQPLNAISTSAINLSLKDHLNMLQKDDISKTSQFIQDQTQIMSKTINDFMAFNKPEKNSEFSLLETTSNVIRIIEPQLIDKNITLEIDIDSEIKVFHNSKNIEHVLLNLITNARDAFENQTIENKTIKIFTTQDEQSTTLTVEDNAGGIPEDIITKVFNPYFTTKEQGKGTGIGLYMSKRMIEEINETTIDVIVQNNHTLFQIRFKTI